MNHKQEFLGHHDIFIVVGSFRFGSTALALMIDDWIRYNWDLHMRPSLFLNEFLSQNHFVVKTNKGYGMEYMDGDVIPFGRTGQNLNLAKVRPPPPHLMRNKLIWLRKMMETHKITFKLDPPDWQAHGTELLEKYLLNDPRSYKIGLCRQDVGNAMISYCIGMDFDMWNFDRETYAQQIAKPIEKKLCRIENIQAFANTVLTHLNWLLYSADTLDAMVWYDQLGNLTMSNIEFSRVRHDQELIKIPMTHVDRCSYYYTNGDDLVDMTNAFQDKMDPLLAEVRKVTQHLVS